MMSEFTIILKNGKIIDGCGSPWFRGSMGIKHDRIERIGDLGDYDSEIELETSKLIVCPGFIDVHTHSDIYFFVNPKADSKIRGVRYSCKRWNLDRTWNNKKLYNGIRGREPTHQELESMKSLVEWG